MVAVQVKNLQVSYFGNIAIQNASFSINKGKMVGIIGPNGAGKSTLIKSLLKLVPIDSGKITIFGKEVEEVRKEIAYVPQRGDIDWDFPITVFETVLLGTFPNLSLFRRPKKTEKEWANLCLERVGLIDYRHRQIGELSGGQQQRVFLARALAQKTKLLFLDEPFVGIDIASEEKIVGILKELKDEGRTILVVHHDLSKAKDYFDDVILLNKKLIDVGPVEHVMTQEKISKAYGGAFTFLTEKMVGIQ